MLWFIIGIVAVVIYIIWMCADELFSGGEIAVLGFMSFLGAMLVAFLLTLFSSAIAYSCADKTYSVAEDVEIYALQDNITTEGSFFLGSGHIDDELKYFYVEETDLGYTIKHVDADDTYIQYTDGRCHLEKHTYTYDGWFAQAVTMPLFGDRYVFYIPEGSVINNYSVDLK